MAKRFTDSEKWRDPWFRQLSVTAKALWQWVLDNCDHAGVIDPDWGLAEFQIGDEIAGAIKEISSRLEQLENGKFWVPKFIPFQYGNLSEECKAHNPVFASLAKNGLKERVSKGYPKGIDTLKDKDKDKDKDKEPRVTKRKPASRQAAEAFAREIGLPPSDGAAFWDAKEGNGWKNGTNPVRDWKATMRNWKANGFHPSQKVNGSRPGQVARANPPQEIIGDFS